MGCKQSDNFVDVKTTMQKGRIKRDGKMITVSSQESAENLLKLLRKEKLGFVLAGVSLMIDLALKLNGEYKGFKGLHTTAELLTPKSREKMENLLGAKIFESYGLCEVADIACECKAHQGMHEITRHAYIEILKDGKPATDMEQGNIILTDLDNYQMPFIRYNSGDLGKRTFKPCKCGMKSPRIVSIDGRAIDFLVSKEGKPIHSYIFIGDMSPLKQEPLVSSISQFQVVQYKNKSLDIRIIEEKTLSKEEKSRIKEFIQEHLGKIKVRIISVKNIPREKSGKIRTIISEIGRKKLTEVLNDGAQI